MYGVWPRVGGGCFGRVWGGSVDCEGLREGALWLWGIGGVSACRGCRGDGRAEGGDGGNGGFGSAGSLNAELGPEGPLLGQWRKSQLCMFTMASLLLRRGV